MKIRFTRRSLRHLEEVRTYIAADDPAAANGVVSRLQRCIAGLAVHPERGRIGRVPGTRELVVPGTPYVIPYRLTGETVDILAIMHGARTWPRSGF